MDNPAADPRPPDTLTLEELQALGFADAERALRILKALPGSGVPDDVVADLMPSLLEALGRSPDPDRALISFDRWSNAVTSRYTHFQYLIGHPAALDIFFTVCGTSQLFSDILIRNPEYFEILANPGVRGGVKSGAVLYRDLSSFVDSVVRAELKLEAMRRFKQRDILRIGARDILGLSDMPSTAREFSNLADAGVQKCYELGLREIAPAAEFQPSFAVIAMGKLGGQELNYSSDIDLIFVMGDEDDDGNSAFAHRLAEFVVNGLSRNLQNGHLFRVDMRLRPEGRFGALVRTSASYRAYYESWAEPWELQALIKARFVAGDPRLGETFMSMVGPYVYRRSIESEVLESIRRNKRSIERKAEIQNQSLTNVKLGVGGIRDIEFLVQSLQLQLGGRNPLVRTPNTLEAISRLRHAGALSADEAAELTEDYQFLRNIEHRLQILYELQTQTMPTDPAERRLLARRMGFPDAESFNAEYRRRTARVREHLEEIFYGGRQEPETGDAQEWRTLLESSETAEAAEQIEARLAALGFRESDRIRRLMLADVTGTQYGRARPEARGLFIEMAPSLLAACARTGDPDRAFEAIDALALAFPNRAELYRSLLEGDELLDRLCRLGASGLPLIQSLARHLEWMDLLVSEEMIEPGPKGKDSVLSELRERIPKRRIKESDSGDGRLWDAIALFLQRERLRIAARDIWGEIPCAAVGKELSAVADAVVDSLLDWGITHVLLRYPAEAVRTTLESVAVIGLGKLGGAELGYGSDWDILLVFDDTISEGDTNSEVYPALNLLAEFMLNAAQDLRTRGAKVEIDPRLRAEGRFGALIRSVGEYGAHYRGEALTWEKQVLTKARFCAGNAGTGRAYQEGVNGAIYLGSLSDEEQQEIQQMKRRIENERLKPEQADSDLKLGHGGLSDIEFTAQLYQMREGWRNPDARATGTAEALLALGASGALRGPEASRLADSHAFLACVRNRISLRGSSASDVLPEEPAELRAVAVGLGFTDSGTIQAECALRSEVTTRMKETRQLIDRLFYSVPPPAGKE